MSTYLGIPKKDRKIIERVGGIAGNIRDKLQEAIDVLKWFDGYNIPFNKNQKLAIEKTKNQLDRIRNIYAKIHEDTVRIAVDQQGKELLEKEKKEKSKIAQKIAQKIDYNSVFNEAYENAKRKMKEVGSIPMGSSSLNGIKGNTILGKRLKKWSEETGKGRLEFGRYGSFYLRDIGHGITMRSAYGEFKRTLDKYGIDTKGIYIWQHQD
jgi:hypothetical protein